MQKEIIFSAIAAMPAVFAAVYSMTMALKRTRLEVRIRNVMDELAAKDRKFNGVVRDANDAFVSNSRKYTKDEVESFRVALADRVDDDLQESDRKILLRILHKDGDQMRDYTERLAHSIAGRRTRRGMFANRLIKLLEKLVVR